EPVPRQRAGHRLYVFPVAPHLLRLAEVQLVDVTRRPAICDVDEDNRRIVAAASELADVCDDHVIVRRILDGHEYALIHQLTDPRKNWSSSQMLSAAMISATA